MIILIKWKMRERVETRKPLTSAKRHCCVHSLRASAADTSNQILAPSHTTSEPYRECTHPMLATVSAKILPDALRTDCTHGVHRAVTFGTC